MRPALLLVPFLLAACASLPQTEASRGLAVSEQRCASCHAVKVGQLSASPGAPPFTLIANREGLTRRTVHAFLRDSHNYPEAMNFTLSADEVDALAAYIVTLKRPDYQPPI